ncbi:MAG: peptide chain release factor N(5)-glutamine methyltransferase [Actinomycetota bacterium]|nr:peptide chain release factor N(5)-glutamine methyltransferase [Actinomycetota bacterium]
MGQAKNVASLIDLGERVMNDSTHVFEDHDHRQEAEELLALCLKVEPDELDDLYEPGPRIMERYLSMVARRAGGEPLPFITGRIEFYGLDLEVRPGAFVPRPSSELTVDRAARRLRKRQNPVVVDVCTGAGPIALALGDEFPGAEVWGTDILEEGLAQGRRNAKHLGISNVTLKKGDMYDGLPARLRGSVDVITGHVPYVPVDEIEDLPSEVKEFEPVHTLSDGAPGDGLYLMRKAVNGASEWLRPGGWLLLEVSDDTTPKVRKLVRKAGLTNVGVASDGDELSEVVEARLEPAGRAKAR